MWCLDCIYHGQSKRKKGPNNSRRWKRFRLAGLGMIHAGGAMIGRVPSPQLQFVSVPLTNSPSGLDDFHHNHQHFVVVTDPASSSDPSNQFSAGEFNQTQGETCECSDMFFFLAPSFTQAGVNSLALLNLVWMSACPQLEAPSSQP